MAGFRSLTQVLAILFSLWPYLTPVLLANIQSEIIPMKLSESLTTSHQFQSVSYFLFSKTRPAQCHLCLAIQLRDVEQTSRDDAIHASIARTEL